MDNLFSTGVTQNLCHEKKLGHDCMYLAYTQILKQNTLEDDIRIALFEFLFSPFRFYTIHFVDQYPYFFFICQP